MNSSPHLLSLIKKVAEEEGFAVSVLDDQYSQYYLSVLPNGHRCIDGRAVLEQYDDGSPTGYKNSDYTGSQFPGGTFGLVGALRAVSGLSEEKARELVLAVCKQQGEKMGDHIDDGHGKIRSKTELEKRTQGCGNQDAMAAGKISMYAGLVDRQLVDDRFNWLKANNGIVPVLVGDHVEKLAAINLSPGKTFYTAQAVADSNSVFNADLWVAYQFAAVLYDLLPEKKTSQVDFQDSFVQAVVRDYMQTLKALGGGSKLYFFDK